MFLDEPKVDEFNKIVNKEKWTQNKKINQSTQKLAIWTAFHLSLMNNFISFMCFYVYVCVLMQ
jgi:hypothetical protein